MFSNFEVAKSSQKYICENCDYYTSKKQNYEKHILTSKHIQSTCFNQNVAKNIKEYYCEKCDYITNKEFNFNKHIMTAKHLQLINEEKVSKSSNKNIQKNVCKTCCKEFKTRSGLWRHDKKCIIIEKEQEIEISSENESEEELEYDIENESDNDNKTNNETSIPPELTDKQVISLLVQQNMKLVQDNNEFKSMVMEVIKNGTHNTNNNTTHTNSHNKTFNLNIFLNEQCKDAVNMSDFVDSLIIELADLEKTGRTNFVEGISNLILKNLRALDHNKRPIHCSDLKRETLYIKDNDKWERESDDKLRVKNIIRGIANENIKKIADWTKKYPDCRLADSRKNDLYLNIVMNSMCGGSPEETQKNLNDIIRNIAKEVVIQK